LIKQGVKLNQNVFSLIIGLSISLICSIANAEMLATVTVNQSDISSIYAAEGVIEAVKSSAIAPQVSGSIIALTVKVGDIVKTGQLLARIDSRIANQQAAVNQAQVVAAQAQLSAARKEYERKSRLYSKEYISQAAMEHAESEFKTAEAKTKAQFAQSGMSNVETGLHTINAPFAGVVSEVLTEVGTMAMPGQPLLMIYDPNGLRATVKVPQSQISSLKRSSTVHVLLTSASNLERDLVSSQLTILPTVDTVTNMSTVRLNLPMHLISVKPGMFARALLPLTSGIEQGKISVPIKAVIKRSELVAVYVVNKEGKPQLRQVRLGRKQGDNVQIMSGLQAGDIVAIDPIAAANFK
jgi:RND family efflux transporter MFP subunit